KTDIRTKIKESLTSIKKGGNVMHLNLENVSHYAFRYGINIDENNKDLQKGKTLANGIMNKLWDKDPKDRKRDILHLQKKFISWSEYSKQLKRMEDIDFDKIHNRMQECRKEQFDMVQNMTSVMKEFIDISLNSQLSNQTKMYFLQWMKIYLDIESKKHLPDQENKYHKMWNSITCKVGTDVNELRKLESTLDDLSFGLEHILREIGQVYEAIKELKRERKFEVLADNLSIFAADLLLDGYPLEIMDGDASHVPLTWINAVFDKLKERLGDKKIYVISVLGIQSSGKSTLLNTMFGLNFSVSAGRCTKGVFAQLISVEEKIYGEYGYEYILVLDTEGLRAMELANLQYKRDNELASFIIGIGAVTIVNIKGENNSDIGEVLQICVHAFLRMRLANNNIDLQPGCYFVHQNVPDVIAKSKMLYSYKKHKDQLDDIATAVAEHENVRGINHFSDVIEFDVNKQIWYFPNLWIGDPPMAPANPGYSETVLKLKTDILKYPEKYSSLTFTKLQERMTDLWKAILNENFVFSFKNSLEVRSYALLEEKILNVNKNFYHDVKSKTHNYINTINSCEKDFSCLKQNILAEIEEHINECYLRFKSELNDYFSTAENKSTINQWEAFATQKLEEIVSYLRYNESNKISTAVDLREANYKNLKKLEKYKDDIEIFVKDLVANKVCSSTQDGTSSLENMSAIQRTELDDMFNKEWDDFLNRLDFVQIKDKKNIRKEVWKFLKEQYRAHIAILEIYQNTKEHNKDKLPDQKTNDNNKAMSSIKTSAEKVESTDNEYCDDDGYVMTSGIRENLRNEETVRIDDTDFEIEPLQRELYDIKVKNEDTEGISGEPDYVNY
ncbi:unnamed protein product, partial [Meganyctiphanes norvegica]